MAALMVATSGAAQEPGRYMLFFDWSEPDIRSEDRAVLDRVAADFARRADARLQIAGHSDLSGPAAHNLRAARKRAEAVRAELEKRGISRNAMSIASFGEERPLVPTEDGVREVQNRRVEITIEE